jgi:SAM-dependent methyltransferase
MLRYRVHGALDEQSYAQLGQLLAGVVANAFRRHALDLSGARVLDFASGPGRVTGELKRQFPDISLSATDIDAQAIEWARDNLAWAAEFCVNDSIPPTRYPGAHFDGIFSVSLFTHLDEQAQLLWLRELKRILKPSGLLVTTTHGAMAWGACTPNERAGLETSGFLYRIGHVGRLKLDQLPDDYQTAFHSREYVARVWAKLFEVVEHVEGGVGQHQDLIVLRKTSANA